MGLILDSSVVIAAERRTETVEELIERVTVAATFAWLSVLTTNLRHFRLITGLQVIQF